MNYRHLHIIHLIVSMLFVSNLSFAQKTKVQVGVQLKIIPKILSLNKNFSFDNKNENINAALLYSSNQRNSKQILDAFLKKSNDVGITIRKKQIKIYSYNLAAQTDLREFLQINKIKVLYITPIRGVNINNISRICKDEKVLTVTAVEQFKENDIAVILGMEDNRLKIMINQNSAKSEGADFSSRLLKIVELIN